MSKRRLRYAPSPTGKLHIGGARTALFNYLIAKHSGGDFILRTEDTDIERNVEGGELNQIENLEWMGVITDEDAIKGGNYGPYRQTERLDIYNKYVDQLLEKGVAYECYCTPEELEKEREEQEARGVASPKYIGECRLQTPGKEDMIPSIRIKVPTDRDFVWEDGVRGKVSFPGQDVGDWVIRKSNGIPTYNFAVVIDDKLMEITDVMRGEEHISNTPKQIHLFEEFGWEVPKFWHLSIIIGKDKKKLSKRDESTLQFIHLYKERGYLPEAIFNFLSLLGWSPVGEEEIFSKDKLIEIFDESRLSRAPSFFDINKLTWTNNYYIKQLTDDKLFDFLAPFVSDVTLLTNEQKLEIFKTFQAQLKEGIEIKDLIQIFVEEYSIDKEPKAFALENKATVVEFRNRLQDLDSWTQEEIKATMMNTGADLGVKGRFLMMPIRLATTGREHGPDIAGTLKVFGKEKTLQRLGDFINED